MRRTAYLIPLQGLFALMAFMAGIANATANSPYWAYADFSLSGLFVVLAIYLGVRLLKRRT